MTLGIFMIALSFAVPLVLIAIENRRKTKMFDQLKNEATFCSLPYRSSIGFRKFSGIRFAFYRTSVLIVKERMFLFGTSLFPLVGSHLLLSLSPVDVDHNDFIIKHMFVQENNDIEIEAVKRNTELVAKIKNVNQVDQRKMQAILKLRAAVL